MRLSGNPHLFGWESTAGKPPWAFYEGRGGITGFRSFAWRGCKNLFERGPLRRIRTELFPGGVADNLKRGVSRGLHHHGYV